MMEKPEEKPTVPSPLPAENTARKKKGPFGLLGGIFMMLSAIGFIMWGIPYLLPWLREGALLRAIGFIICEMLIGRSATISAAALLGLLCGLPMVACCVVPVIVGIMELIGGIFAIKRTYWAFALIAAILGSNILGIIFVAVGRKEFES